MGMEEAQAPKAKYTDDCAEQEQEHHYWYDDFEDEPHAKVGDNTQSFCMIVKKSPVEVKICFEVLTPTPAEEDETEGQCRHNTKETGSSQAADGKRRKARELKIMTKSGGKGNICHMKEHKPKWIKLKTVIDSGACTSVTDANLFSGMPVRESKAKREGVMYNGIGGEGIPNAGEIQVNVCTKMEL